MRVDGISDSNLICVCRALYELCRQCERHKFTGRLWAVEDIPTLGLLPSGFMEILSPPRHQWMQDNLRVIRFTNQTINPAVWKIHIKWEEYPHLQKIELDCRYHTHFAIHNVHSFDDFVHGRTPELEKCMDFRRSFFLSCEKFFKKATKRGLRVTVIRAMGVREAKKLCQAVVVAIDYIRDDGDALVLDMNNIKTQFVPIVGWPHGIKPALASLTKI